MMTEETSLDRLPSQRRHPNYGVFVFNQAHMGTIRTFVEDIWTDYGVTQGKIADIV